MEAVWHCLQCGRELAVGEWDCPRCDAPPPPRRFRPRQALKAVVAAVIFIGLFMAIVGAYWSGFGWFSVVIALVLVLGWIAR